MLVGMTQHTHPHTLTEEEAGRYVGYTISAMRLWRRQRRGPAYVRVGRSIRYLVSDLDQWLAAHRVEPRAKAS